MDPFCRDAKDARSLKWYTPIEDELEGMDELYDLRIDPYEMKNLIHQPVAAKAFARMKQEMERLLKDTSNE